MRQRFFQEFIDLELFGKHAVLFKMAVLASRRCLYCLIWTLEIIYKSFKVVRALLKVPAFLIATCLIMKNTDD